MKTKYKILVYPILIIGLCCLLLNSCKKKDDNTPTPGPTPTLTTAEVTNVLINTAKCGGTISSDGGSTITEKGVCWSTHTSPTTSDNKTNDGAGAGLFTSEIKGLLPATTYYLRAYATTSNGTGYGSSMVFTTLSDNLTDIEGNVYKTVQIGDQIWMAENLKTTKYNDGTNIPLVTNGDDWSILTTPAYCWYNNDMASNKLTYGALYNWYAIHTGKLCPVGWHVPSDAEWYTMEHYVDSTINDPNVINYRGTDCGTKLKNTSGWDNSGNGTNNYNFKALPGGGRYLGGAFFHIGDIGNWWSSTEYQNTNGWFRTLLGNSPASYRTNGNKFLGFSVRCIRD